MAKRSKIKESAPKVSGFIYNAGEVMEEKIVERKGKNEKE